MGGGVVIVKAADGRGLSWAPKSPFPRCTINVKTANLLKRGPTGTQVFGFLDVVCHNKCTQAIPCNPGDLYPLDGGPACLFIKSLFSVGYLYLYAHLHHDKR